MRGSIEMRIGRRAMLGGLVATGLLALPACSTMQGYSLTDAIRRLLLLSSQNAFDRLTAPGGFYEDRLSRIELPQGLGKGGDKLTNFLTSAVFREQLEKGFAKIARRGAAYAAPRVADAIRTVSIPDAQALIRSGPTGATQFLRQAMGGSLIEVMVPELGEAIRVADDPLVAQVIASLTGLDNAGGLARNLAGQVNAQIWNAIGREEETMRAHPDTIADPLLRHLFKAP